MPYPDQSGTIDSSGRLLVRSAPAMNQQKIARITSTSPADIFPAIAGQRFLITAVNLFCSTGISTGCAVAFNGGIDGARIQDGVSTFMFRAYGLGHIDYSMNPIYGLINTPLNGAVSMNTEATVYGYYQIG